MDRGYYERHRKSLEDLQLKQIKDMDSFLEAKFNLEVETFSDMELLIESGIIHLDGYPLGCILEILRFNRHSLYDELTNKNYVPYERLAKFLNEVIPKGDFDEMMEYSDIGCHDQFDYEKIAKLFKTYGFNLESPASFFQGVNPHGLSSFVEEWHNSQTGEIVWNLLYAPAFSLNAEVEFFCKSHNPNQIISEFNTASPGRYIFTTVPFDGFAFAGCLQLVYEGKSKSPKHL